MEQSQQNQLGNMGGQDGFSMIRPEGVVKEFLEPGFSIHDLIVRAGMAFDDSQDYASMYRKGITFKTPSILAHAIMAFDSAAGADRQARIEALSAVNGMRGMGQPTPPQKPSFWARIKRRGKDTAVSLEQT
jgi:hypothetical protein